MGELVMKDPCSECGGNVVVITAMEMALMGKKQLVSHGICSNCMHVVVMPPVEVSEISDLVRRV